MGVVETDKQKRSHDYLQTLRLTDDQGRAVTVQVKTPVAGKAPHPVILTLGGVNSGGRVAADLPRTGDFVVVSIDYPYDGRRRGVSAWEAATRWPAMRRALLDTVPATMLAVDYLFQREDIDQNRIVLVGGSLGALIAPAAAAAEPRIDAVAVLFGAGNIQQLIMANLRVRAPLQRPLAWIAHVVLSPLEPLKYIGRVTPRPVLLINGTGDARMPAELGRELQDRAKEPKTTLWFDIGHASIRSANFRGLVINSFADWLVEEGILTGRQASEIRVISDTPTDDPEPDESAD
jgi:fermentation-respiration switch protein FrsA (DUF1100 family)